MQVRKGRRVRACAGVCRWVCGDHRATPASASKQSSKALLCLFVACSLSILRLVVLWKDWKHVLHLMVRAAAFYFPLVTTARCSQ